MDIYSHTTEIDDVLYEEMKKFEHRNERNTVSENWTKTEPAKILEARMCLKWILFWDCRWKQNIPRQNVIAVFEFFQILEYSVYAGLRDLKKNQFNVNCHKIVYFHL